jgi:LysR family transcriptional regulator, hca operon transcriptional activator
VELRHLRYFVAVAEEGSFLGAASRLRVAQPALSKQIHDLEREVGAKLFERRPRGTRMTAAGEQFLRHARNALESAARAVATARKAASATGLTLALGDVYVYTSVMLRLLAAFRHESPETLVRVVRVHDADQAAALRERRVDVAATFVGAWPVPGLAAVQLTDCTVTGVLLPSSHPLAAHDQVRLADLHELVWLHPSQRTRPEVYRVLRSALETRGLVPARHHGRRGDIAANLAIAAGDSWALANPMVAAAYADLEGSIVYRPFVDPPIPLWYALVWRTDATSPLIEKLVDVARRSAASAAAAVPVPAPA